MFTFTVKPDAGELYQVTATSRDVLRWEQGGKGRSLSRLNENLHMNDMYDLAFTAVLRLGLFDGDIRDWRTSVDLEFESADEDDEGDDAGPTRSGR